MVNPLLHILSERHSEWISMVASFRKTSEVVLASNEDIVQQMYVNLDRYNVDPEKIMFRPGELNTMFIYVTLRNIYFKEYNQDKKQSELFMYDSYDNEVEYEDTDYDYLHQLDAVTQIIQDEMETWHHYDKRVFQLIIYDGISMRELARETKISLTSIFNTVKACREKIKLRIESEKQFNL